MSGASSNDVDRYCGLTPCEVELTIKAMITMLEAGARPDFEKLASMTHYTDANAASRNWYFTAQKLKNAGSKIDGKAGGNNKSGGETGGETGGGKAGKKRGKRQAADALAAPAPKRGCVPKSVDDGEEKTSRVKAEADENVGGEA